MKAKRKLFVCSLMISIVVILVCSCSSIPSNKDKELYSDEYINLAGDWNFKVYRKYSQMYQYLPYGACSVTWEDAEIAKLPSAQQFKQWETVKIPAADYSTGGLQQMYRIGDTDNRSEILESDLFPKWSEAWYCTTIELPQNFIKEENIALLLGIIDDMDVVYINGTPVAASGFKKADGTKALAMDVPDMGGFLQDGDFRFEKSYWEVSREYAIPASYFHEGENEIAIRVYNNNSFGGFYNRPIVLASTQRAVRYLKGLPTEEISDFTNYNNFVTLQSNALRAKDIVTYSETLSDTYYENEQNKSAQVAKVNNWFSTYETIEVFDTNTGYYFFNGYDVYSAHRKITGINGTEKNILYDNEEFIQYFIDEENSVKERGNWNQCYTVAYTSTLEGMNNTVQKYSVYLPPSYYINTSKHYPVVYLLHGINSTGESFVNVDKIENYMNKWINSGDIVEMIVVMPNAGKNSFYKDSEGGPNDSAGPWASFISKDIRQLVEANYRTLNEARFRGLTGISMGAAGTFNIGLSNTDIYSSFATHMGAVPNVQPYFSNLDEAMINSLDFYLDCGLQDQMVSPDATKTAGEFLETISTHVTWELRDGAHNSAFYMEGMPASMKMHSDHFIRLGLPK